MTDRRESFRQAGLGALLCVIGVFVPCMGESSAQEIKLDSIQGSLFIAGKTPLDPPLREPRNTHAYVTLEGPGALTMYQSMRSRERDDECRGVGWKLKSSRHFVCSISKDRTQAECDFAINLRRGRIEPGKPC